MLDQLLSVIKETREIVGNVCKTTQGSIRVKHHVNVITLNPNINCAAMQEKSSVSDASAPSHYEHDTTSQGDHQK